MTLNEKLVNLKHELKSRKAKIMIIGLGSVGNYLLDYLMSTQDENIEIIVVGRTFEKMEMDVNIVKIASLIRRQNKTKITIEASVDLKPIDLRVFPALRVELRFFPLLRGSGLETPVTELAFAPLLAPVAACVDELCIAADDACGRHGGGSVTPLKLLLHFADAESFATEAMGCAGRKDAAGILNGLAAFFTGMITRRPEKITCG